MDQNFKVTYLDRTFGATVTGIKLADIDDNATKDLYRLWLERSLLIFPAQHLTNEQQVRFAEEAKEVVEVAQLFYKRMATWSEHFAEVGNKLGQASKFYNKAVGSWETNVLPQGRKLEKLDIATNLPKNLVEQKSITETVRTPTVMNEENHEKE